MTRQEGRGKIPVAKEGELYSLKWQTYQGHISSGLQRLYTSNDTESLRDVTLGSEGQYVKAHKVILSLCSPYFRLLFQTNKAENGNMIIILEHLKFRDLKNVIHFIYNGEIQVKNSDLKGFLRAGESLQIEGLAKGNSDDNDDEVSPPPTKSRRAGSTGATSFTGESVSFLPQPSSSKSSTAASTTVHPVVTSTASTAATPSSCNSQTVKRTRLGRVIKPTVPAIDYDDSNFSLEEEVETDRLALDSAVVTLQENNRLKTTTSKEKQNDGEVVTMNVKTEIPGDFFAIDSNDMESTDMMHEETEDGNECDSGDSNHKLSTGVSQDQDSMTSSFSNDVEIVATYGTPPTTNDVRRTASATITESRVFLETRTKTKCHESTKSGRPFDMIWGYYDTIKDTNGKIRSNKCKACFQTVSAQATRMRRHLERSCKKTTFTITNNG